MKLYVCWGTFPVVKPGGHACRNALEALNEAGYEPEVVKAYGGALLPDAIFNRTRGRREAKAISGSSTVPVLVTDDGEVVPDSGAIVAWAKAHPASARATP